MKIGTCDPMKWWGRDGEAHYFPTMNPMVSACGRRFSRAAKFMTRLSTETGEPWPHCAACKERVSTHAKENEK